MKKWLMAILPFFLGACNPLVPSNYLGPGNINRTQTINGHQIKPHVIELTPQLLCRADFWAYANQAQLYRVGAYDYLNIIIWGHPQLSTLPITAPESEASVSNASLATPAIAVNAKGNIFYPYVGLLQVKGLTIEQVQKKITARLSEYIKHPQVTVQIARFRNRSIFVLGEVKTPGMQAITDRPLTLMEAISAAGGIDPNYADPSHIYIIRGNYIKPTVLWLEAKSPQALLIAGKLPLQEHDIVYISSATLIGLNRFLNQILPGLTAYVIAREFHDD